MTVAGKNRPEDAWERPRILLLASMWPPQTGGVEEYLSHVYSRVECLDLWVVAPHHPGASAYDSGQRWKTKRFSTDWFDSYWTGRRRRASAFWALTRMISVNHIECIHAGSVVPDGVLAWMLHRAWGIPYLVYSYGRDLLTHVGNPWGRTIVQRVLESADRVVVCSQFIRDATTDLGHDPANIHVAPPGVDAERFRKSNAQDRAGIRAVLGIPSDTPMILSVSRLVERKGHDRVIAALPGVRAAIPDVRYVVVGDGPNRSALELLAHKLGLADVVTFAGRVVAEELPSYYASADLFVLPNRAIGGDVEGFGIVFLEAAAAGLPVIAGDSGGAPEAVEDGVSGALVDPHDSGAIGAAMVQLLGDRPLAARMGAAGRARVEAHHTWASCAAEVSDAAARLSEHPWEWRPACPGSWWAALRTLTQRE